MEERTRRRPNRPTEQSAQHRATERASEQQQRHNNKALTPSHRRKIPTHSSSSVCADDKIRSGRACARVESATCCQWSRVTRRRVVLSLCAPLAPLTLYMFLSISFAGLGAVSTIHTDIFVCVLVRAGNTTVWYTLYDKKAPRSECVSKADAVVSQFAYSGGLHDNRTDVIELYLHI